MIASQLPVYIDTYRLVGVLADYVSVFPKMYKYTLGQKIVNVSLELFEYIQLANMTTDNNARSKYLQGFQVKHELLKVLVRLSTDKKIFTLKQSALLAVLNDKIGKQISGWKNSNPGSRSPQHQGAAE